MHPIIKLSFCVFYFRFCTPASNSWKYYIFGFSKYTVLGCNTHYEFQTASGSNVSTRTVRRELHEMGLHGRAAADKPKITMCNAKCWLEWCKARRHWTLEQWKRVLWSDESRCTIWQMPGERSLPECIVSTVKFGGRGIMVCGCFSWFRLGPLIPVKGYLNATA